MRKSCKNVSKILEEMMNLVILFEKMISPLRNAKKKNMCLLKKNTTVRKYIKYIYILYVKYIVIICYNYILRDVTSNRSTLP